MEHATKSLVDNSSEIFGIFDFGTGYVERARSNSSDLAFGTF